MEKHIDYPYTCPFIDSDIAALEERFAEVIYKIEEFQNKEGITDEFYSFLDDMIPEIKDLNTDINKVLEEGRERNAELRRAGEDQLENGVQEVEDLQKEIDELKDEATRLEESVSELEDKVEDLISENEDLRKGQ